MVHRPVVRTDDHVFWSFGNIGNVLEQSAGVCVIALGQLLVILTRGIDLSIGSNVSLSVRGVRRRLRDTRLRDPGVGVDAADRAC